MTMLKTFIEESLASTKDLGSAQQNAKLSEDLMSLVRMRKLTKSQYILALNANIVL